MANYNLTSQQLKDTYQQLVQVSGSAIVDGTGSLVNGFDYPSNSTYNSFSSSVATVLDSIVAGSGSADWTLITNKPAGLVSGSSQVIYSQITGVPSGLLSSSAQIATEISGAFVSTSASLAADIATNTSDIATKLPTSTFTTYSSSVSIRLTTDEGNISTNATNISTQTTRVNSLVAATSSYAVLSSNNIFGGSQTFNDVVINGTASISYLQSVTGSAKIIGDAFIILNNDTPTQPKGGISVVDTGSTSTTSSFLWDGLTDDWKYEYHVGGTHESAVALFGSGSAIGVTTYPTNNKLQKGTGTHHLHDSNITDDGSQVSITGPVSASTYYGDGSNLTGVESGLVAGTGPNSLRSSLTSIPAIASASLSIAIGNNVTVESGSTGMIAIGHDINGSFTNRDYSIVIGAGIVLENDGFESVAIGSSSRGEDYTVAVGPQASGTSYSVAIGKNANAGSDYSIAIGANALSQASGTNPGSIAIGQSATATSANATAVGKSAEAAANGTALGYSSLASGVNAVAVGNSTAGGVNAVSIGEGAGATNTNTTALGVAASAGGDEAVSIGTAFGVNGNNALGIGRRGTSSGDSSIAIGSLTEATANNAIAIGASVSATSSNAINIGNIFQYNGVSSINLVGSVTSSIGFKGDGSGLTNLNVVSSSYAVTSSFAQSSTNAVSASYAFTASSAENFEVRGQIYSPTFAGSVVSSTSSIDFDNGNFATLSLTSATHLGNPSNLKSGTTYTIIVSSGSLIASHGSAFKFASGTSPTYSNGTDVLTMVSDGTNLYATALTDFQ